MCFMKVAPIAELCKAEYNKYSKGTTWQNNLYMYAMRPKMIHCKWKKNEKKIREKYFN
jgi:hypothetical protein